MKSSKILLPIIAVLMSAAIYASPTSRLYDLESLSQEIEFLLKSSNYHVEEGENVTVFFSISEDNRIQHVTVASEDEKVTFILEKKLKNRQLDGSKWREGMIYELSVGHVRDTVMVCGKHI